MCLIFPSLNQPTRGIPIGYHHHSKTDKEEIYNRTELELEYWGCGQLSLITES